MRIIPVTLTVARLTDIIQKDPRSLARLRSLTSSFASSSHRLRLYYCWTAPRLFFPPRFHFVLHKHRINKKISRALLHCQRDWKIRLCRQQKMFTENYIGNYTENYTGNCTGNYTENYTGNYTDSEKFAWMLFSVKNFLSRWDSN